MSRYMAAAAALASIAAAQNSTCDQSVSFYNGAFSGTYLNGTSFNLSNYNGETVPHYTSLNVLMSSFGKSGFTALGYPCNQFGGQEPGDNSELLNGLKYVRPGSGFVPAFDLTQKVSVNGALSDPVWSQLRSACPAPGNTIADFMAPGWMPITTSDVAWNFEAVLLNKAGYPYRRYATAVDPLDTSTDIQTLLSS